MDYSTWESKTTEEKTQLLKLWIQELMTLEKNVAKEPTQLYNNLQRRKWLKNNIKDITAYERIDFDYEDYKKRKNEKNC
jgi:hypothetical protein